MQAAAATGVPMAFGVLTTMTEEQAVERVGAGDRQQGAGSGGRRTRDGRRCFGSSTQAIAG